MFILHKAASTFLKKRDEEKVNKMKKENVTLGIDTTTKICEVSLKIGEVYKVLTLGDSFSSEKMLPMIDQILKENELTVHDLTNIVVNIGPGSFTGIRVGVAIARAIAQIKNIEICGVVGLDIFMYKFLKNTHNNNNKIVVLQDALRDEFYSATYDAKGNRETEYAIVKKTDLDLIDKIVIETAGNLGEDLIKFNNQPAQNYQKIKPFYLRKTAAEEKKEKDDKKIQNN